MYRVRECNCEYMGGRWFNFEYVYVGGKSELCVSAYV